MPDTKDDFAEVLTLITGGSADPVESLYCLSSRRDSWYERFATEHSHLLRGLCDRLMQYWLALADDESLNEKNPKYTIAVIIERLIYSVSWDHAHRAQLLDLIMLVAASGDSGCRRCLSVAAFSQSGDAALRHDIARMLIVGESQHHALVWAVQGLSDRDDDSWLRCLGEILRQRLGADVFERELLENAGPALVSRVRDVLYRSRAANDPVDSGDI